MHESDLVYLDNHSTTRCDPRVVAVMLPLLTDQFANIHSPSHEAGREAASIFERSMQDLATTIGCQPDEIIITSGATESNNLAIQGVLRHPRQKRDHVVTVTTEHQAVLDPVQRLEQQGFRVTRLSVAQQGSRNCGQVDLEQLKATVDERTALVSVMLANNEIGVIQNLSEIAEICHQQGALVHSDATQAVGRIALDVDRLGVDLLSAAAHKFYGPKGVGFLYVRRQGRRVRLLPQIEGGGQQQGIRSGTLNVPGAVAMAHALRLCEETRAEEAMRIDCLAQKFLDSLTGMIPECTLNGPARDPALRLVGNLNICFPKIDGQSLMSACPTLALSSGSACSSLNPAPSHVLRAIGLAESEVRRSLRVGIGRFNTEADIDQAAQLLAAAHARLSR